MVLGAHAIIGGAVASATGFDPSLSLVAGWASHYLCDYFPHWDYKLRSAKVDLANPLNNDLVLGRDFCFDLVKLFSDVLLGLALVLIFFVNLAKPENLPAVMAGAIGGLLPDLFQFVYMKLRREPFTTMQKIHNRVHSPSKKLKEKPLLGFLFQLAIVAVAFLIGNWRLF